MNTLRIVYDYRGRLTHDQLIAAGVYPSDDPMLHGLADYLVRKGVAVWVDAPPPIESESVPAFVHTVETTAIEMTIPDPPRPQTRKRK
jgi:hypothetical protein